MQKTEGNVKRPMKARVRDVEVEVRAFFFICCTLLNVLVRKGKKARRAERT